MTVRLSAASLQTITVDYATSDGTATAGEDYTAASGTVTFSPGDITETVSVSITDDDIDEDAETLKITLSDPVNATVPAGAGEGTISITDDDTAGVTVTPTSLDITEGGNKTYTIVLDSEPAGDVTVTPGGITDTDLTLNKDTLTFTDSNWDTAQSVKVTVAHDDGSDDESATITHTVASSDDADYEGISASSVAVAITDDEDPQVKVSFEQSSYTVAEESSVTIKVKLDADPERTVAIHLSKNNQGGATGADYSGVPTSVTFNSGDTEKTFSFSAASDNVDDDGESVKLTFGSLPTGVSEDTTKQTVVSITDDDVPQVTVGFENATYSVSESDDADTTDVAENSVTIKVRLSADPERTVTVPITKTDQDGASSADYSGVPASVVFNSGDTSKEFTFSATHDTVDDDDEKVKLTFGTLPTRVSEGTTKEAVVSINDDDVPSVTVSFGATGYTVDEGSTVAVKVKLSKDPERTVTLPLSITHFDGVSGADYSGVPGTVTFQAGDTEKSFSFAATQDTEDDDGEYVLIGFVTLPARVTSAAPSQTTVSITDDDGTPQNQVSVRVSFETSSYQLREGSTVEVTVELSADPERDVSIPISPIDGTGVTSADYSGVPASLDLASGDTEKSFTFTAAQDSDDENLEEVMLGFGTLPAGVTSTSPAQASVAILDSVHVSFDASTFEAYEGGAGALVTVELDQAAPAETVIPITATGMNGATADDWTGVPASLTFDAGDTEKSFTVMAYDDDVEDDGEAVELTFGTLPAGVAAGTPGTATVELMNTEEPVPPACEDAVWCADVEFADKSDDDWGRMDLFYHPNQDPGPEWSSISDDRFDFDDDEYFIWNVSTYPGVHPDVLPRASASVPERSVFSITLGRWDSTQRFSGRPKKEHYQDWILWVGDEAFPLSETDGMNGMTFVWLDEAFFDLYAGWEEGKTYRLMIEDSPLDERPARAPSMPSAPRHLEVINTDHGLAAMWHEPLDDGNSPITHYLLQWKLRSDAWSDQTAVSETEVDPPSSVHSFPGHAIYGLTNEVVYDLRVISVNAHGESPPSNEHFGMPQENGLKAVRKTVNGDVVTLTYNHALDTTSVPDKGRFIVLANGGLRPIDSVAISGRNVNLTLESGVNAADRVTVRYIVPPVPDEAAIRDTTGRYAYTIDSRTGQLVVENLTDPAGVEDLTAEFVGIPDDHDGAGDELRFKIRFSEPVRIDSGPPHGYLLEVDGGKVTSAWWLERDTTLWQIVLVPEDDHDITVTLPAGRPCIDENVRGGPCASGDRKLTTRLEHTIDGDDGVRPRSVKPDDPDKKTKSDGEDPSEGVKDSKDDPPPANSPATGTPSITGTARVGETLTADVSAVKDTDGLEDVSYTYQWQAGGTDIAGATNETYTLTADEVGQAITVQVSFTDDDGNNEELVSGGTAPVVPALPSRPTNLTATVNDDGSITLNWDAPDSGTVTGYQILRRRPHMGEDTLLVYVENTGSAATTYTDTDTTPGTRHTYRVKAINDGGVGQRSNYARVTP